MNIAKLIIISSSMAAPNFGSLLVENLPGDVFKIEEEQDLRKNVSSTFSMTFEKVSLSRSSVSVPAAILSIILVTYSVY